MPKLDPNLRTKKLQVRLRPAELAALQRATRAMGVTQAQALRGWIAAGLRRELPCEGVLTVPPLPLPEAPAELVEALTA